MKFELSPELIDQIIFAMEDQEHEYFFDSREGLLVLAEELDENVMEEEEDRFVPIPEWRSVDGFNLMERFTATLRNPVYRERLRQILSSGKGVFRQFKNAVKERPDMEKLWFLFKNREMKRAVYRWYNGLRESWGLKEVDFDEEGTEDLVLSDFQIGPWPQPEEAIVLEWDRKGFLEMVAALPLTDAEKEGLYQSRRYGMGPSHPDSKVFQARTPAGDLVAFLWAMRNQFRQDIEAYHILQVYCKPEYRGIGLSRALIEAFCGHVLAITGNRVTIELIGSALELSEFLEDTGFKPFSQVLEANAENWQQIHRVVESS